MNVLDNALYMFKKRENVAEIEEGKLLSPKFDNDGLIPVITTCSKTKEILMHGFGRKVKRVVLFKRLKKYELMTIKMLFG